MRARPWVYRSIAVLLLTVPLPACSATTGAGPISSVPAVLVAVESATRTACTVAGVTFGWTLEPSGVAVVNTKPDTSTPIDPG